MSSPWPFPGSDSTKKLALEGTVHEQLVAANTRITRSPDPAPTIGFCGDTELTHDPPPDPATPACVTVNLLPPMDNETERDEAESR